MQSSHTNKNAKRSTVKPLLTAILPYSMNDFNVYMAN